MEPYHKQIAKILNEELLHKEANDPKTVGQLRKEAGILQKELTKLRQGSGTVEDYLASVEHSENTLGYLKRLMRSSNPEVKEQLKEWLTQDQATIKQILYAASVIKEELAIQLTELSKTIKKVQEMDEMLHS